MLVDYGIAFSVIAGVGRALITPCVITLAVCAVIVVIVHTGFILRIGRRVR